MSLLSSILAKTKATKKNQFGKKKWRHRVEIENERVQSLEEKSRKRKREIEERSPVHKKNAEMKLPSPNSVDKEKVLIIAEDEIFVRLRRFKQPVTFFGETKEQRFQRLKLLDLMKVDRKQSSVSADSEGGTNEFQTRCKAEVEAEIEAALAKSMGLDSATDNLLEHDRLKKEVKRSKYDRARAKSEFKDMEDYQLFYFKRLNREWEKRLKKRSEAEKLSLEGKAETARQKQARRDIKPFFKLLKKRTADPDIVKTVTEIVDALLERKHQIAQQTYLELSIGNAPWPIGITQIALHVRPDRQAIRTDKIAHIMNHESQRKYIQAMKRYMTFAEKVYPPYTTEQLEARRLAKLHEKRRSLQMSLSPKKTPK